MEGRVVRHNQSDPENGSGVNILEVYWQRVEKLLCTLQVARCPYHNTQHFRISLFSNYQAGIEQLPTQPHQVSLTCNLSPSLCSGTQ